MDLGGRVPPNNPGFPPPDPVRPGAAPVVTHSPTTPKPRSQGGKRPGEALREGEVRAYRPSGSGLSGALSRPST